MKVTPKVQIQCDKEHAGKYTSIVLLNPGKSYTVSHVCDISEYPQFVYIKDFGESYRVSLEVFVSLFEEVK